MEVLTEREQNNINAQTNTRYPEIDIMKGLAIITICMGHAGWQLLWFHYVYIIVFFYVAGYTFKTKPILEFIKSKFIRLYVSFCFANILGLCIWPIISTTTNYCKNSRTLLASLKNIFCFNLVFNLMAPGWFILPFSLVIVIFYIFKRLIPNDLVIFCITCSIFLYTCKYREGWMKNYFWNDSYFIPNVGIGLFVANIGYLIKKYKEFFDKIIIRFGAELFLLSMCILYAMKHTLDYQFGCRESIWSDGLLLPILIVFGLFFMIYLSRMLGSAVPPNALSKIIIFAGKHSMAIMYFHIPCFSIITIFSHLILELDYPDNWTNSYDGTLGFLSGLCGFIVPMLIILFI